MCPYRIYVFIQRGASQYFINKCFNILTINGKTLFLDDNNSLNIKGNAYRLKLWKSWGKKGAN